MEFNPQKQLAGLLEWMDQQMTQCGGKTAVIGISGGKDSSTVAALAVAAYGRENVYGVLMPNGVQPDIDYSQALVEHLQIPHCTINIHDAVQGVLQEMEKAGLTPSRQTAVNLPSRVRMALTSRPTHSKLPRSPKLFSYRTLTWLNALRRLSTPNALSWS